VDAIPSVVELLKGDEYDVKLSTFPALANLANHGELRPNMILTQPTHIQSQILRYNGERLSVFHRVSQEQVPRKVLYFSTFHAG
jgi:hypothetical protein